MTSRTESATIRSQLILRKNQLTGDCEVYSTLMGSGIFRWFKISKETYEWYLKWFPEIKLENISVPSPINGEIIK